MLEMHAYTLFILPAVWYLLKKVLLQKVCWYVSLVYLSLYVQVYSIGTRGAIHSNPIYFKHHYLLTLVAKVSYVYPLFLLPIILFPKCSNLCWEIPRMCFCYWI